MNLTDAKKAMQVKIEQAINQFQLEQRGYEVSGVQIQKVAGSFHTLITIVPPKEFNPTP
jgi:hypothetical protein